MAYLILESNFRVGNWTCDLGPVKLVLYPLGGGTLLFMVTVSLLLWVMYIMLLPCLPVSEAHEKVLSCGRIL